MERKFNIEKEISCDVLVVGGGCAGLAAGICAARHGADIIIAEQNGYLGGTATAGMVGPFMTSYDVKGETQLIRGFFDEFVRRMEKTGGAIHPSKAEYDSAYAAYRAAGHRNLATFDGEAYKRIAEDMCAESGVRLMYHLFLMEADSENGKVTSAYFATKSGIYKINAKVFIDCSGDADLAYYSGAQTVYGNCDGEVQAASMFFSVIGVDKEKMDKHMKNASSIEERFYMKEILKEREKGRFPLYRAKIALYEGLGDEWLVNMSQLDDVNAVIPEEVTAAEIEGRRQIEYIISFLRKYAAGCENIRLVRSAASLGVRESRRIKGEYTVTKEDVIESVKFRDSVFCCSNSMDIHKKGYVEYIVRKSDAPYYIPYRALVAKNFDNLLAAGRCISAEREVMGAIRVMPPCFAMGQAAGTAAALCAVQDISVQELNAEELAEALKTDGVYLG